jgi:broad specificity phosphatase PhoE
LPTWPGTIAALTCSIASYDQAMAIVPRTLLFARHGETSWNHEARWQGHTDIALNDRGREQAAALAARLRGLGVGHVFSSDLQRARETAAIVAKLLMVDQVTVDPRLRERGFGAFEGLTRDDCASRFPEIWAAYEADRRVMPPGSEPHDAVIARLRAGVAAAIATARDDAAVLVVGHGGALRLFLTSVFDRPFAPIANGAVLRAAIIRDGAEDRLHAIEELTT